MFRHAIVRVPAPNFAEGLSSVDFGSPDFALTLVQHRAYCEALERCGLQLTHLPADPDHPDSTFVEDTAICTEHGAILTRPGAPSREGEVKAIAPAVRDFFAAPGQITAPGTVDGGDICEAGSHVLIGLSHRTNEEGARQLAAWLLERGYSSDTIDVRGLSCILHLKSGISYLGENRMVTIAALADHPALARFERVVTEADEDYAANLVRVNDHLLMASGYPKLEARVKALGYSVIALDMSEYRKMDGGLSCLSLRF